MQDTSAVDNTQPGFISSASNVFTDLLGSAFDVANKSFGLYQGWSSFQSQQDATQAQIQLDKLRANQNITTSNAQLLSSLNTQQVIKYGVIGLIIVGSLFAIPKVVKALK